MNTMTAYCGIDCIKCPAYIATQANDHDALERTAETWRKQYNSPDIAAENHGRLAGYCHICKIRACGIKKGVENCAYCSDYDTCSELAAFHAYPGPAEAKATLDSLRSVR